MVFDNQEVSSSLRFNEEEIEWLRTEWLELLDIAVFGPLHSGKIGSIERLRKRSLEVGSALRSLSNSRAWIPHPREQIKSAFGASVKLRDAVSAWTRSIEMIDDREAGQLYKERALFFCQRIDELLGQHEAQWSRLLDSQYDLDSE